MGTIATIIGLVGSAWSIVSKVLSFFGMGKAPSDPAKLGEALGKSEANESNSERALNELKSAVEAGDAASLHDDPNQLRDGSDPAARNYRPGAD